MSSIGRFLGRRGFVSGMMAAPVAAKSAVEQATNFRHADQSVVDVLGGEVALDENEIRLTNLSEYLKYALSDYEGDRHDADSFDPDILEMRVPMVTKVRMQHKRNYARRKADMTENFWRQMKKRGFARWFA